jgi:pumilio RNA-binding family
MKRSISSAEGCATSKLDRKDKANKSLRDPGCTHQPISSGLAALLQRLDSEPMGFSLLEVLPCLVGFAQDPAGCRFICKHLQDASKEVQSLVIGAAIPEIVRLSMHQHGHVLILDILDMASEDQMHLIVELLMPQVKQLTLDSYGCRVIQKTLKLVPHESCQGFCRGLQSCVIQCIKSMHGNHVIQVCIEEMPPASVLFVVDAIETWGADSASAHMYACRVVMRLLEYAQRDQMQQSLHQIFKAVGKLAQDRYGNYVLQHILEHGETPLKKQLILELLNYGVLRLATQKYAHNVVEKCIVVACNSRLDPLEPECRALSLALVGEASDSPILSLIQDRFGAMVVECLVDNLQGEYLKRLALVLEQGQPEESDALSLLRGKCRILLQEQSR